MNVRVPVTGPFPYDVLIGRQLSEEIPLLLDGVRRAAVVAPPAVSDVARNVVVTLRNAGVDAQPATVPDGEAAKNVSVVTDLWERFARLEIGRTDAVIGVGGGATTDVVGFAAATWLRGVRVVLVPTTLLGMVDAAIGGKTGINTAAGKNLVGAFHPPAGVVCDLEHLRSLPDRQWASGLAEVVKCGFIADPAILHRLRPDPRQHLGELVERAVRVKAAVVSHDFREAGLREVLNYGHTLGHAIERAEGFRWRHGDAIAVGMVYAAALARESGRADLVGLHRDTLAALDLPVRYPAAAWPVLLEAMRMDKKSRDGRLRFVVLDGVAAPEMLEDPAPELLTAAYREVSE